MQRKSIAMPEIKLVENHSYIAHLNVYFFKSPSLSRNLTMKKLRRQTCILLLFIASFSKIFSSDDEIYNGWIHLELGAGNYGPDGHTKSSQAMTVLQKIKDVTNETNYIDELENIGKGDYKPEDQYGVLFWTLDQLIVRYGDTGVFHVNDLYEEYATFATQKLIEYKIAKGFIP